MKKEQKGKLCYVKPSIKKKKIVTNLYHSLGFQNSQLLEDSQIFLLIASGSIVNVCSAA